MSLVIHVSSRSRMLAHFSARLQPNDYDVNNHQLASLYPCPALRADTLSIMSGYGFIFPKSVYMYTFVYSPVILFVARTTLMKRWNATALEGADLKKTELSHTCLEAASN